MRDIQGENMVQMSKKAVDRNETRNRSQQEKVKNSNDTEGRVSKSQISSQTETKQQTDMESNDRYVRKGNTIYFKGRNKRRQEDENKWAHLDNRDKNNGDETTDKEEDNIMGSEREENHKRMETKIGCPAKEGDQFCKRKSWGNIKALNRNGR